MAGVVIVRSIPGGVDRFGTPIPGTEERIEVPGAIVAPRVAGSGTASTEVEGRGRQGVVVGKTVYLPAGVGLRRTDRIEVDGTLWTVEGESGEWVNPYTGRRPGAEVAIRRAEG